MVNGLEHLVAEGVITEVLARLQSGKEAEVYVVRCGEEIRCAKVYKEANKRSFRQAVQYTEGRKVKNSRQARAMEKGTRYGRKMQEEVWQNAEVDALYRLAAAGVRVPQPFVCFEGTFAVLESLTQGFAVCRQPIQSRIRRSSVRNGSVWCAIISRMCSRARRSRAVNELRIFSS